MNNISIIIIVVVIVVVCCNKISYSILSIFYHHLRIHNLIIRN